MTMSVLERYIATADGWIWGCFLMFLLVGTGVYLTIRLRFVQFRLFFHGWDCVSGRWDDPEDDGEVTYLQALSTALAATIGTGNIAGVATAITAGGPGAVFWMWVTAIEGMSTKFTCCMLAHHYRDIRDSEVAGGPMYYLSRGLNMSWLGAAFALFAIIASFGIGNMVQANSVVDPFLSKVSSEIHFPVAVTIGAFMASIVALVIIGGIRRIARVAEKIVPFMAMVYVGTALVIIALNFEKVPAAFHAIFAGAFGVKSALGGAVGYGVREAMRFGIARGLFSNESGLGSAAIAHAAARTKEPVREGCVAMLGPFIDTIVICTMTALIIVMSGLYNCQAGELNGAALSAAAFEKGLPRFGSFVVSFGLIFFSFTTIIGWSYYGDRSVYYLFGRSGRQAAQVYRWLYVIMIPVGASIPLKMVWNLADIANGLMAFPNLVALVGLSGVVANMLRDYERRLPDMNRKRQ